VGEIWAAKTSVFSILEFQVKALR